MSPPALSVVVIGRNEGERLTRCLEAVRRATFPPGEIEVVYVDSGSSDGSPERAARFGVKVIGLQPEWPTPALGREVGWRATTAPLVLFLDGDSMLEAEFVPRALPLFDDPRVAVVWGRVRELAPRASIYHRVLDLDWRTPAPGPTESSLGNCLVRRAALEAIGGFRTDLTGGECAEYCMRIRAQGWLVWHTAELMVRHDLALSSLAQYVRRCFRLGYHRAMIDSPLLPERRRMIRRHRLWGSLWLTLGGVVSLAAAAGGDALTVFAGFFALSMARACWTSRAKTRDLLTLVLYALHQHVGQILSLAGQVTFWWDRRRGRRRRLIEYRQTRAWGNG